MARVVSASGYGLLTPFGKRCVAASMYLKGRAFIGAATLASCQANSEHNDYVVLHLLCQGIELSLKGLLLFSDYDKHIVRLVKHLGYNLFKIAVEASAAYGLNPMRADLAEELRTLNNLYSKHLLRYGSGYDIGLVPSTRAAVG